MTQPVANAVNERTYEHNDFTGLRNNTPVERFELSDLTEALNVDIDDSLEISRRDGFSAPVVAGSFRSVWASGNTCLALRNETDLVRIQPDYSVSVIRSGMTPARDISYTPLGSLIGYSNGIDIGIVQGSENRTWGLSTPTSQGVATNMGGSLVAGTYQYAVSYMRRDGQHSGTPRAESIEVTDGGIAITSIPVSNDQQVDFKMVWISERDAEHLYLAGVIPNAQTTFNLVASFKQTVRLSTQFLSPAPAGRIVRQFNGRALIAVGSVLHYSEPFAYELFDLRKHFTFPAGITLVEPMNDGVYLSTSNETFWLGGDIPEKWELDSKFSYGAIPGTTAYGTADMLFDGKGKGPAILFASTRGLCAGLDGGNIVNLTQDRFTYPITTKGAGILRRYKGTVQYVAALRD